MAVGQRRRRPEGQEAQGVLAAVLAAVRAAARVARAPPQLPELPAPPLDQPARLHGAIRTYILDLDLA
ncbi:hypothetical protein [Streptomyces sp. enrichment culture]|uniref:hypothetical protein n=1 Tax=Streptomyces sp. enrichment culture TaxID=1795815 RepID=UPI003F5566FB